MYDPTVEHKHGQGQASKAWLVNRRAANLAGQVAVLALLLCTPWIAWGAFNYTREQVARLNSGEIITRYWKHPGGDKGSGWAAGVIDSSPEEVFAVVAAVERYPEFFERMAEGKIVKRRSAGSYDFYYRINMPWPLDDHWCFTRNIHEVDKKKRRYQRRWKMIKGTFEYNKGSWTVTPWGKARALLRYRVTLKPRMSVPDFVLHHVSRVALPRSVKAIRARVLALTK